MPSRGSATRCSTASRRCRSRWWPPSTGSPWAAASSSRSPATWWSRPTARGSACRRRTSGSSPASAARSGSRGASGSGERASSSTSDGSSPPTRRSAWGSSTASCLRRSWPRARRWRSGRRSGRRGRRWRGRSRPGSRRRSRRSGSCSRARTAARGCARSSTSAGRRGRGASAVRIELSEAQRQLRDAVRAFARERLAPAAEEIDRRACFPRAQVADLARLGALGCFVPERFGGAGFDHVAFALVMEEVAAGCAATAAVLAAHAALVTSPILAFGTDAQRARYLPRLASGEWLGCFALGEPGADAGAIRTTARRAGDGWVLNGTKHLVTNAPEARLALVVATPDAQRERRGLAAFLVETDTPGWQLRRIEEKMGMRGAVSAELALTDVRVPAAGLLGGEGQGLAVAEQALDGARIGLAAAAVGIARAAFEATLVYVGARRAFGQRLADFQATQFRLADMAAAIEAARLLALEAAFLQDRGVPHAKEAAMAKLYAAETAMTVATQAVQLHGGYGYTREFPVERHFRDAKMAALAEGTSASERLAIATHLLREARAA